MLKELCEENMFSYFLKQSPFTAHEERCAKFSGLKEYNKLSQTLKRRKFPENKLGAENNWRSSKNEMWNGTSQEKDIKQNCA